MSEFVILRPWWLAVLPVLAVLAIWLWRRGPSAGGWERVMPPAMLAAMRALGHLQAGGGHRGLAAVAAAALIAAGLAGPALPRSDAPLLAGTGAVLIALDMSPSVTDGPALADAKAAAAEILSAVEGRPVGLILYAGEAYDVAAPTADPTTLESQIAVLGPGIMPDKGSRPASALALARRMLDGSRDAAVVLISDGGGLDAAAVAEAQRLTGDGVRLLALTLDGSASGGGDPAALADIAATAAPARASGPVLAALAGSGSLGDDPALSALRFRDFGPAVAGFAVLPLLALFRRRR
ncbi:VWA domain-containing protein [Mongoliimonas terrestris]|uniref:VWA domain-containing protein n=1 Tax=Mongoliimonas terrestris TaxID=1709001 RepID=UPI00094982D2|nr:vWA domain-containing protein [Mongoliimonas terrestris]